MEGHGHAQHSTHRCGHWLVGAGLMVMSCTFNTLSSQQGGIHQLNLLLLLIIQGQWGVTAAEEEEENRRIREFQDSIPKMCSQLRILTHFYQVCISACHGVLFRDRCLLLEGWPLCGQHSGAGGPPEESPLPIYPHWALL